MALVRLRTRLRGPALAILGLHSLAAAASAQEVLFLRIRPHADPAAIGTAGSARAALAAREAVWERSNARARAIIETVCTGCLAPWSSAPGGAVATASLSEIPVVRGVEPDHSLEASDATLDPSIPERRP